MLSNEATALIANVCNTVIANLQADIRSRQVTRFGAVNTTGRMASSLSFEQTPDGIRIWGVGYSQIFDRGRRPGTAPPRDVILQWIQDKGIRPTGISLPSLAFLIARKIKNRGTEVYIQGGTDLFTSELSRDSPFVQQLADIVATDLAKTIQTTVLKQFAK
ncbi:MAG: hypothetical protein EBX40_03095 [Gammaproteobacteria bacterium]|nr:hypothetical protein [Gammaproteobacteria bacterium]